MRRTGVLGNLYLTFKGLQLIKRFLMGQPLDGKDKTNSRFLTPGTIAYTRDGYASVWAMLPGWQRLLWRLTGVLGVPLVGVMWLVIPAWVMVCGLILASVPIGYNLWQRWIYRRHNRDFVRPLALVLARHLGYARTYNPRMWLKVPRNFREAEKPIVIQLPPDDPMPAIKRGELVTTVEEKLNISDLTAYFRMQGKTPFVELVPTPRPPDKVTLAKYGSYVNNAAEATPFLGIGRDGKGVYLSFDEESPHVIISMGTGGGKSVLAKAVAAHVLRHGGDVHILDYKRRSHRWARKLPGVTYAKDIADIHDTLIGLACMARKRNFDTDLDDDTDTEDINAGNRQLILLEEINATMSQLRAYWEENRPKDGPKTSPAVRALGEILYMGRAVKVNVLAIGQRLSAKAMGDADFRDNFPMKLMGRYTKQTWNILASDVQPMPISPRKPGRVYLVHGGTATEVQTLFMSDKEVIKLVTESDHEAMSSTPFDLGEHPAHEAIPPQRVTKGVSLSDAIAQGLLHMDLKQAQNARYRDPRFPKPIGKDGAANVYDPATLERYGKSLV